MAYQKDVLGVGESSTPFIVVGNCDIWVTGLTTGSVKLQVAFPDDPTTWVDYPGGSFTYDTVRTIFISEHGISARLTGVSNNAGVSVRIGRFQNK